MGKGLKAAARIGGLAGSPSPGPGPRSRGAVLGGAEAWPLAARPSGPSLLPEGPRGLVQPRLPPAPAQAGHQASNLRNTRHPEPFLDSDAGRVRSPRTEPGSAARKGQLFMGRPGVLPRPALSSGSPEDWGEDGGKFPEQSWSHFSFSQVSTEHLLDAGPSDWGYSRGRNVRSWWAPRANAGNNAGEAAAQDQVTGRKESLDPLPSLFPSFPSLPSSRLHLLGSTPSPHQFLPHFPALPGFSLKGPFSQGGADAEPHCLSPSDCSLPGTGPATPPPSPQP